MKEILKNKNLKAAVGGNETIRYKRTIKERIDKIKNRTGLLLFLIT